MDMKHLVDLSHDRFEIERLRMIGEFLATVPEEHRDRLMHFQDQLNKMRANLSPDRFLLEVMRMIHENLENIEDQLQYAFRKVH